MLIVAILFGIDGLMRFTGEIEGLRDTEIEPMNLCIS
jgi:hypothetical protein